MDVIVVEGIKFIMSEKKSLSIYQLLEKKKQGIPLSSQEIKDTINSYTAGKIPDYQMSALLMAIYFQGMDQNETAALTDSMLQSGKILSFKGKDVIDKHSTGGIGDKASFILAPLALCAGVKVPMIAGRGLGHTGGTIDKVEAITGFDVNLSLKKFTSLVEKKGFALIGQTPKIAPADRLLYALRDVTATVDSIPLITASIMSKKLAEGANGYVFDVKYGDGAFMPDLKSAKALAQSLTQTAKRFNKNSVALITNMYEPLGDAIGHSLEIQECIAVLQGQGPKDVTELSVKLAAHMIHLAGKASSLAVAQKMCRQFIQSGEALSQFKKIIKAQGGDTRLIDKPNKLQVAKEVTIVKATKNGHLQKIASKEIGHKLIELGGGRHKKSDPIDLSVGFIVHKKIGALIKKGDPLITIYHHKNQAKLVKQIKSEMQKDIFFIGNKKCQPKKLVQTTMRCLC